MRGFSLVELSIVLVILGLLTGGILAGQNLIRAAELRAVSTEKDRIISAVHTFRDKYFALPGDMRNATAFWTEAASGAACKTSTAAGTCDGDGNGGIQNAPTNSNEIFRAWQHLALAGLIEGSYSGVSGAGNALVDVEIGINAMRSKLSQAGWMFWDGGNYAGDTEWFAGQYGNTMSVGVEDGTTWSDGPTFTPEEAWNIDTKTDDGQPGTGSVWALRWDSCTGAASNGLTTVSDKTNSEYLLTLTSKECALVFVNTF